MLSSEETKKLRRFLGSRDERLAIVFNALGDKTRCKIFRLFLRGKAFCVGDSAEILGISMSSASQHLKILELTGLLTKERVGRRIFFKPNKNDTLLQAIIKVIS